MSIEVFSQQRKTSLEILFFSASLIILGLSSSMGQEATIKGTVLDENGASMVGVYVSYGDYKKDINQV